MVKTSCYFDFYEFHHFVELFLIEEHMHCIIIHPNTVCSGFIASAHPKANSISGTLFIAILMLEPVQISPMYVLNKRRSKMNAL